MDSEYFARQNVDTVENEIARYIIVHDNVDYASCADLIYSLIADAKQHLLSYLNDTDTEKVMRERQKSIAAVIYAQMNEHFKLSAKLQKIFQSVNIEMTSLVSSSLIPTLGSVWTR